MALPTVTLTGQATNPDGSIPVGKTLTLQLQATMLDASDAILVPQTTTTITLDHQGSFSQEMVPSDAGGLAPNPVSYLVREMFGADRTYYVEIPSANPTVDLWADLAPVDPPPAIPSAYLLLPSGTPAPGDVPVVSTANPLVTEWSDGGSGPQGAQGFQGSQGSQGTQGTQGFQGNAGSQGNQGFQGTTGSTGTQGNQGTQGTQGNQGFQGTTGSNGSQGNQGFQGTQGNQGFQGTQGNQGFQGTQGNQGFQGNQGAVGQAGIPWNFATSTTMADPSSGNFRANNSTLSSVTALAISATDQSGNAQSGVFNVGDEILLTDVTTPPRGAVLKVTAVANNSTWFQLTVTVVSATAVFSASDLVRFVFAPQGTQGSQGNQGNQGSQGNQGNQGSQGNQGNAGSQGNQGFQGAAGGGGSIVNLGVATGTGVTSGTGDTALFVSNGIPANTLVAGSLLRCRLAGVPSSTGTQTFKLHIGTAGTVSDVAVVTSATTAGAAGANRWVDVDFMVVIRTNGSSGTAIGSMDGGAQSSTATVMPAVVAPATVTVDTTQINFLTVSCACSVGTFTSELASATQFA